MLFKNQDTFNPIWMLIGFVVPPIGLLLYFVWRFERSHDGKYALIGAIMGFILYLFLGIMARVWLWNFFFD